jgi:hypothetical protein
VRFDRQPVDRTSEIREGDDAHSRLADLALRSSYAGHSL